MTSGDRFEVEVGFVALVIVSAALSHPPNI
jgi:hypothetical protein